jgi:hypothetical protein
LLTQGRRLTSLQKPSKKNRVKSLLTQKINNQSTCHRVGMAKATAY